MKRVGKGESTHGEHLGPGSVIAGRYRLDAQLGQGGMGSVWRAEHLTLRSPVAVKLIDPEIAGQPETLERFQVEAQAAATLRSPHVVQILDYGVDGGVPYIVMEMLEGESLAGRLARVGQLPHAETARFVTHVARALSRAHEAGIVHRDLKPENVFLVRNDDQDLAKVLDFGIAKAARTSLSGKGPTRTGNILGTPGYMSPEQAQGTKAVDGRSDLWSLGVMAFECVVGQVPFESAGLGDLLLKICVHPIPIPSRLADVPPGFDAWFARACGRAVEERFQTAKELSEALRLVLLPDSVDRGSASMSLASLAGTMSAPSSSAVLSRAAMVAVAGTTMPGMALGMPASSKRHTGAYLAAALGLVLLGAAGAWLMLAGRGAGQGLARASAPPAAPALLATALPAIVAPTGGAPVAPAPAPSIETTEAPPAAAPESSPPPTPNAAKAKAPAHHALSRAAPPPPKGGDRRLGF